MRTIISSASSYFCVLTISKQFNIYVLLTSVILLLSNTLIFGTTLTVNDDGGGDHTTITAAIAAASSGDTIFISGGADNTHTEQGVAVSKALTFIGQGQSTTIIQANTAQNIATDRVFTIPSNIGTVTFQDMTIQHGKSTSGAGLYIWNNNTVIFNSIIITKNNATESGGAIFNTGSHLIITNSAFNNNTSQYNTGITSYEERAPTIFSENITGNHEDALSTVGSNNITGCTFTNNISGLGGAVFSSTSSAFTNCTFSGNYATSDGGAIYKDDNNTNTLSIINCTVANNSTAGLGGGLHLKEGTSGANHLINTIVAVTMRC